MVGGRISCCFATRKFKTITGISYKVKFTVEHNLTVGKPKVLYILPNADLTKVHSVAKPSLAWKIILAVPLAGQLKLFLNSPKMLTWNQEILYAVEGYKIPFATKPHQKKIPRNIQMSLVQENLVDMETSEMLTKGAISFIQKDKKKRYS